MNSDYYNSNLNAVNVFKSKISKRTIKSVEKFFNENVKGNIDNTDFNTVSPSWNSDIKWISVNTRYMYDEFLNIFKSINLDIFNEIIDLKKEIRCYSVFFVTRTKCNKPNFHTDFNKTGNNGFTLMTPLTNIDNDKKGHLLYKDKDGKERVYKYKRGECIIFGDSFVHSTQPYKNKEVTFLCFTFGSDKKNYWKNIFQSIGTQQKNIMRYDKKYVNCQNENNRLGGSLKRTY